jgi:Leucine-rich repeat (LRR) protein
MLPPTLTQLNCRNNQLTCLPLLPPTLIELYCYDNQLTALPLLPLTLTILGCENNNLTILPVLPPTLTYLNCWNNQLTCLPVIPPTLTYLNCSKNPLTLIDFFDKKIYPLEQIIRHSQILSCFKYLYYSLRFKSRFRDWLYKKVREPHAQKRFHPKYLLEHLTEHDDLEEVLANWK